MRRIGIVVGLALAALLACAAAVWGREHRPRHVTTAHHRRVQPKRRRGHRSRGHRSRRHRHARHRRGHRHHRTRRHAGRHQPTPPPAAAAAPAVSTGQIRHVVWVLMENQDYGSIIGSGSAPYINSLANTYGVATDYSAISHPSLPNYIGLTSGSDQGIPDDGGPSSHALNVPSIFSQLPGGASQSLEEGMPSNCDTSDSGQYAVRRTTRTWVEPAAATTSRLAP